MPRSNTLRSVVLAAVVVVTVVIALAVLLGGERTNDSHVDTLIHSTAPAQPRGSELVASGEPTPMSVPDEVASAGHAGLDLDAPTRVRVTWTTGGPVVGARVRITLPLVDARLAEAFPPHVVADARTDDTGVIGAPLEPSTTYEVGVEHASFGMPVSASVTTGPDPGGEVTVTLAPPCALVVELNGDLTSKARIDLVDSLTRSRLASRPIEGARCRFEGLAGGSIVDVMSVTAGIGRALASYVPIRDAETVVAVRLPEPPPRHDRAEWSFTWTLTEPDGSPVSPEALMATGVISLGQPIQALIASTSGAVERRTIWTGNVGSARVMGVGRTALPPPVSVTVSLGREAATALDVRERQRVDLRLSGPSSMLIDGVVPIVFDAIPEEAMIMALELVGVDDDSVRGATLDSKGTWRTSLPPGRYRYSASPAPARSADDLLLGPACGNFTIEGPDETSVPIAFAEPTSWSGLLEPAPAVGVAVIECHRTDLVGEALFPTEAAVGPDGRFTFRMIAPGSYRVSAKVYLAERVETSFSESVIDIAEGVNRHDVIVAPSMDSRRVRFVMSGADAAVLRLTADYGRSTSVFLMPDVPLTVDTPGLACHYECKGLSDGAARSISGSVSTDTVVIDFGYGD